MNDKAATVKEEMLRNKDLKSDLKNLGQEIGTQKRCLLPVNTTEKSSYSPVRLNSHSTPPLGHSSLSGSGRTSHSDWE